MAEKITFQNDPVDPSVEFRKPHNHFFMADRAVVEQAGAACQRGHPLLRPLFFEFPGDPGSRLVEDQYLLGTDLLVAPLFEDVSARCLYLPPGRRHRFAEDEGTAFDGPARHTLEVEEVPAAVLVRDGASPRIPEPAQHPGELDWDGARGWRPAA